MERLMEFFRFGLNDYSLALLTFFLLLVPAALYIMGLMEGRVGRVMFLSGILLHLTSIIHRGLLLGWLPLTEKHDNLSLMAFVAALLYLYLMRSNKYKAITRYALPFICGMIFVALKFKTINTISPFMQSPWFFAHSLFYFLAFAWFGLAACFGLHYVLTGEGEYEVVQYRLLSQGWILLSVALFAGSVWFYLAYGTYWLWSAKELWISITWLYVGLYLHARLMRSFHGVPAAVMGVLVFGVALFTYFGVGTVIPSPPTQF
jgi:ABC-type transport system involved in cytochrome c biogenesis permease subunit